MNFNSLHTERLELKEVTPEYRAYAFNNFSDEELVAWFGFTEKELPAEKEKHRLSITNYNISFLQYVMVVKESGEPIGRMGYHNWFTRHNRSEVGYHIALPEQRNKGYASEALKAILKKGFEELKLYRVEAFTSPDNAASINVLNKHGFVLEGVLRGHFNVGGEQVDSSCYSLLLPEYEKVRAGW